MTIIMIMAQKEGGYIVRRSKSFQAQIPTRSLLRRNKASHSSPHLRTGGPIGSFHILYDDLFFAIRVVTNPI